jgi:hypothetical protein
VSLLDQFLSQLHKIEDFPIEGYPKRPLITRHRLVAAFEVNNAKPIMSQADWTGRIHSGAIWPSIVEHTDHPIEGKSVRSTVIEMKKTSDATHQSSLGIR